MTIAQRRAALWRSGGGPSIVTEGLALHLNARLPQSYPGTGITWANIAGGGYDFYMFNASKWLNEQGGLMLWDNQNWLNVSGNAISQNAFTIEYWLKPASLVNFNQVLRVGTSNGTEFVWHSTIDGAIYCGPVSGGRFDVVQSNIYQVGVFGHQVYTYNNGAASYYKNGQLLAQKSMGAISAPLQSFTAFRSSENGFDGEMALFRVYSGKALTGAEVAQNYLVDVDLIL